MRMQAICLFFCVLLFSCGNNKSTQGKILSTDKMQAVMWDIFQAEALTDFYLKKDSTKNIFLQNAELQKKIFSIHQVSKEDFYTSYDFYSNHSSDMRILLDSISAKGERQRNTIMQKRFSPIHKVKPVPPPPHR